MTELGHTTQAERKLIWKEFRLAENLAASKRHPGQKVYKDSFAQDVQLTKDLSDGEFENLKRFLQLRGTK